MNLKHTRGYKAQLPLTSYKRKIIYYDTGDCRYVRQINYDSNLVK